MKSKLVFICSILWLISFTASTQVMVNTFYDGTPARFYYPYGLTLDANGNIYVADSYNQKVRKISSTGDVSTIAGSGGQGSIDGQGMAANFYYLKGVAVDAAGNIYVGDAGNNKIRKISPSGLVSTLAGSDTPGSADGQGNKASFYSPHSIAVDVNGNLIVADCYNNKIRKISPTGLVSTFAGSGSIGSENGQSSLASFNRPTGVALDSNGNVYVADSKNNQIRKISSSGFVSTLAGSGSIGSTDGQGTAASFYYPCGVAVDANGNVYVADAGNHKIRTISPNGLVSTLAGSGLAGRIDEKGNAASFNSPFGVTVDANRNVYVADYLNNTIRKISPTGIVSTLAGISATGGLSDGKSNDGKGPVTFLLSPTGVSVDAKGSVYVSDQFDNKIKKISNTGVLSTLAGSGAFGNVDGQGISSSFGYPNGIALDVEDNLYVADASNNSIRKISPTGLVSTLAGSRIQGSANGQGSEASFNSPNGVAVDADGNVYVADYGNRKIRKITPTGIVSTLAGSGLEGSVDGIGITASFIRPSSIAVDATKNVYVTDESNHKIRKISSSGFVSTLAGSGSIGSTDGQGTAASFYYPNGIAVDAYGNIYVGDTDNEKIRKISPTGLVTTLAGFGVPGSTDENGTLATFNSPQGVAVDAKGNLFVADFSNYKIRKITLGSVLYVEKNKLEMKENAYLYPNPSKNTLFIHGLQGITSYQMTDAAGVDYVIALSDTHTLDISDLQDGMYFLKAHTQSGIKVFKFVKE
ncbi:MAG: SMP-30/gluconolactonase/LRE family protein [Opitutaceae bacterium]|nr:SMP-30/gluconolactonase/LRE family protein [Cytophagales bacterium]